jgi:hypothetical protein
MLIRELQLLSMREISIRKRSRLIRKRTKLKMSNQFDFLNYKMIWIRREWNSELIEIPLEMNLILLKKLIIWL